MATSRLLDKLNQARRNAFVGREREIQGFQQLLSPHPEFVLYYMYGPGGQGKSTLIRKFKDICNEKSLLHFTLDGRELEAHPKAIFEMMQFLLGIDANQDIFEALEAKGDIITLFVDTYEKLSPIDDWLCREFLPQMPANIRIIICGRNAPSLTWQTDPGWKAWMKTLQVRNFSPEESKLYLEKKGIPESFYKEILSFTHGHPLALSLIAEIYEQQKGENFTFTFSPDIVRTLLELFLQKIPEGVYRQALDICALVHTASESLLAEVLADKNTDTLFDWLRQLSFMEQGGQGLYPHEMVREVMAWDLKWRHPDSYAELHEKIRMYYIQKIMSGSGETQKRTLFELIYLHRLNPVVKPFFDWQESGIYWMDFAQTSEYPLLREWVLNFEGEMAANSFDYWIEQPFVQVWIWRDKDKNPSAFVLKIDAHLITETETPDIAMNKVLKEGKSFFHFRTGEQWAIFRFWMAKDTHQQPSQLQSAMFLSIIQYYFTPGLGVSMLQCIMPELWESVLNYADLHHSKTLDFVNEKGFTFGWYMHDWRVCPPLMWLDIMGKREIQGNATSSPVQPFPSKLQMIVLSESEFADCVMDALKNFQNEGALIHNPLTRSRLILKQLNENDDELERVEILKQKLIDTLVEIEASPLWGKYYRVLYRNFIKPVGSQENMAEGLKMSFSTYRRYVKSGVEIVIDLLWKKEVLG